MIHRALPLVLTLAIIACGESRDPSANGTRDGGVRGVDAAAERDGGDEGARDAGPRDGGGAPDAGGCGDLYCEAGENAENCASDCGYTPADDSACTDLIAQPAGALQMTSSILDGSPVYTDPFGVEKRAVRYGLELGPYEGREIRIHFDPAEVDNVEARALDTRCGLHLLTKIFEETRDVRLAQTYTVVNEVDRPATITFQIEHRATATRPLDYEIEIVPMRCSHPSLSRLEGTVTDRIEESDPERLFRGNRFDVYAFDVGDTPRTIAVDVTTTGLFVNVSRDTGANVVTLEDAGESNTISQPGRYCVQVNESSPEASQGTPRPYQLTLSP